jgi:UDP-2,4-diacetamido-2,4,6-trideoxy-beta-L-altropyranose hydrolase
MQKPLLIRVDANVGIGTGHVMRMIALAEAWKETGGDAVFLCAETMPALKKRIRGEGFSIETIGARPGTAEDLEATCAAIARYESGDTEIPVALDGYQFNSDFQRGLKITGCRLLAMDDYGHAGFYHADWVLNQNISAYEDLYPRRSNATRLLLGPKFALLRKEFMRYRGWQRDVPEAARKVLVTLGGSDSHNITKKVIEALDGLNVDVKVAVGGSNPHLASLRVTVAEMVNKPVGIELMVNPENMPELMAWADLAVAAAGSTSWELLFMGLPSVFVITAENQKQNARVMEEMKLGISVGEHSDFERSVWKEKINSIIKDQAFRESISEKSVQALDGLGVQRVLSLMLGGSAE